MYRLGIVYIMNDDSLTPTFNLRGCSFRNIGESNLDEDAIYNPEEIIPTNTFLPSNQLHSNSMGVFKNPNENENNNIIDYLKYTVKP